MFLNFRQPDLFLLSQKAISHFAPLDVSRVLFHANLTVFCPEFRLSRRTFIPRKTPFWKDAWCWNKTLYLHKLSKIVETVKSGSKKRYWNDLLGDVAWEVKLQNRNLLPRDLLRHNWSGNQYVAFLSWTEEAGDSHYYRMVKLFSFILYSWSL